MPAQIKRAQLIKSAVSHANHVQVSILELQESVNRLTHVRGSMRVIPLEVAVGKGNARLIIGAALNALIAAAKEAGLEPRDLFELDS